MVDLSIIIVSFNTKELTENCLKSLVYSLKNSSLRYEVIVVDNNSTDGSVQAIKDLPAGRQGKKAKIKNIILIENKSNFGFAKANNVGLKKAQGKYILFLNSDTDVDNIDFKELIQYMDSNSDVGALTVKVLLPDGFIDPACHRGFPTIWRAFCYFSKLEYLTARVPLLNRVFGGYHLTHLDKDTVHEIDSPSGAFYLTRKSILDKVKGFDEDFFMYGEDLDLSLRIKKSGFKVMYYPKQSMTHFKGQSGRRGSDGQLKKITNKHFYNAMKVYFKKHYGKVWN